MHNENSEITPKQVYEKPKLRVIELVAEEVMGVGCKTAVSVGPLSSCNTGTCFNVAS